MRRERNDRNERRKGEEDAGVGYTEEQIGKRHCVRLLRETRGCKWHEKIRKKKWKR